MVLATVQEGLTDHVTRVTIRCWTDIAPKKNY